MNILDYLASEFSSFDYKPFNPIDSAILSQFCMLNMESISLQKFKDLTSHTFANTLKNRLSSSEKLRLSDALRAEHYDELFTGLVPDMIKENMFATVASPRFRNLSLQHCQGVFDEDRMIQFGAMTFVYEKEFAYVAFRGTDKSFAGWREDANMTYQYPIPSQELALRYLEFVAPHMPKKIFVGGHSKGGNLAEFAALNAKGPIQKRIECVYNHDGPGFKEGAVSDALYTPLKERIHKTVPHESVVGMLLCTSPAIPLRVVKSQDHGMMQHSIFNWEIKGDDFIYLDELANSALATHAITQAWLGSFSTQETERLVAIAFEAIQKSSALDASDLLLDGIRSISRIGEAARLLEPDDREFLLEALRPLADMTARDAAGTLFNKITPKQKPSAAASSN